MSFTTGETWTEANQRALAAEISRIRGRLTRRARSDASVGSSRGEELGTDESKGQEDDVRMSEPAALEKLCAIFSLSAFERDVLLLCAGVELDSTFAARCAAASGDSSKAYPTFSLALATLSEPHWSALLPVGPLRRWRLIEIGAGESLTTRALRIDERILHYLTGLSYPDERLHGLLETVAFSGELSPSQQRVADRLAELLCEPERVVQIFGNDEPARLAVSASACAALGLPLFLIHATEIPTGGSEREALIRLCERETLLSGSVLLVDCDRDESYHGIRPFVERVRCNVLLMAREPLRECSRPLTRIDVRKPTFLEQEAIWDKMLGPLAAGVNGEVARVAAQFDLDAPNIRAAGIEFTGRSYSNEAEAAAELWEVCRAQSRRAISGLAQRIDAVAIWEDLVLPESQRQILREMVVHVRHRFKVFEDWGFSNHSARGLGTSALFSGPSGTGKTLAAEVLANELRLDLYRIDLSQVVSKYIGETEKNLARVFEAAEGGGAILLFDEADSLFGKRSEVKDSHDRYANIEVSYLLQRMESYRGLAILTTNMKSALDPAFLRRIRFIVQFPFPDLALRSEIWQRIFPKETPTEGLDFDRLARLNVPGGNIRNIAVRAAFLAADSGEPVQMTHLRRAAQGEYAKIEKPLTEGEIGGWR